MFGSLTYIIWLALFVGLPLLALAVVGRRALWRRRRALAWMLVGAFAGGWAWDALAVRLGAWYYDPHNILDWWIGGLPVEEWLWIIGVTLLFGCATLLIEEHSRHQTEIRDARRETCACAFCLWSLISLDMGHFSHLTMLLAAGAIFHAILWARNAAFLWSRRRTILLAVGLAELWTLLTDPIGGRWGAWFFDPDKVLGLWLFTVMPVEDLLGMAIVSSAAACAVLVFGYGPRRWV